MDWPQQRCHKCWDKTSHLKWRWSRELNAGCTNMGLRLAACIFHLPTAVIYGSLSLFVSILHNVFLLYYVDTFVSVYKIDKLSFWIGEVSLSHRLLPSLSKKLWNQTCFSLRSVRSVSGNNNVPLWRESKGAFQVLTWTFQGFPLI